MNVSLLNRFQLSQHFTSLHKLPILNVNLHHLTIPISFQHQLHLHSLHRHHRLPLFHHITHLPKHLSYRSRHGRFQHVVTDPFACLTSLQLILFESKR